MIIQEGKYLIFPVALLRCIIRKNETLEQGAGRGGCWGEGTTENRKEVRGRFASL